MFGYDGVTGNGSWELFIDCLFIVPLTFILYLSHICFETRLLHCWSVYQISQKACVACDDIIDSDPDSSASILSVFLILLLMLYTKLLYSS